MLYLTTREKLDVFTAIHALREDRGKCGGFYVPYRLPNFSQDDILALQLLPLSERFAKVLNLFFNTKLSAIDIEFAIGRHPVRVVTMSHKIAVVEAWHNHDGNFDFIVTSLYKLVTKEDPEFSNCPTWFRIAVRIAVLFAVFSDLMKTCIAPVDISVAMGDFTAPMAIWYARKMGLPIGNIIFGCDEDSPIWDFLHNGTLSAVDKPALEILLFELFGFSQVQSFVRHSMDAKQYSIREEQLSILKKGLFCAVVGQQRVESIVQNQFNTNQYFMDPNTAVGFGGLQDYRVTQFETRPALILSDVKP